MNDKHPIEQLADDLGGKIIDGAVLPDGSGCAVMSLPLPKNHWIYGDPLMENHGGEGESAWSYEPSPMPMRMGTDNPQRRDFVEMLTKAGRYAVRAATMKGTEMDFDPDALIQNLITGMLGYHTPDGLSDDEWANPRKEK
jgi:hypothetical protein